MICAWSRRIAIRHMIGDGEISGFVGFDIYIYIYFFFLLVFLVLLRMGFLVFDFFFFFFFPWVVVVT